MVKCQSMLCKIPHIPLEVVKTLNQATYCWFTWVPQNMIAWRLWMKFLKPAGSNQSDCCFRIDDNSQAVIEITTNIKKMAHVPIQVWKGWDPNSLYGGWFSALGGFKTLIVMMALVLGACLMLPCLVPLVLRSIRTTMEAPTERKIAAYVMILCKYKPLSQDDAL
jgi:hypothetical protein